MPFLKTPISGLLIFEPKVFSDDRGYFYESYNQQTFAEHDASYNWVQDNQAQSSKGVLRGLHYQCADKAQAKLVRVLLGSVQDVAVDLRTSSPTYGQSYSIELTARNHRQLLVPRGFAHGYLVLEDETIFCYKCDNVYSKKDEGGLHFSDPQLNISWALPMHELLLSEKDRDLPNFGKHLPAD